jgi:hypothetical protein
MAKTATDIPITQGSGVNLSNFALASGRRRQTVILADADDSGEALCAELPAHDGVDRGSPLKVGGRASAAGFAPVAENDRVDAWFSLSGQQVVVNTVEPAYVYEKGRQVIGSQLFPMTAASAPLIGGVASQRIKVLSFHVACTSFTSAGSISVLAGSGGFPMIALWVSALGNYSIPTTGYILAQTAVNQDLWWTFTGGAANFAVSLTWYNAP